ncbi:MAG: sugar phosphate isomerase/epimerase [Acidobacteria bacterium]|nr:sugar phosphate isomerase/epimerase [Acidobacteriota bacterium]
MQPLADLEIGVMFWAGRDPLETVREVRSFGVRCGQLAFGGDVALAGAAAQWGAALAAEQLTIVTAFCAYVGEDYADIPTVQRTVGFIPPATREEREQRTLAVSDFAAELGIPSVACHIGFVPEDENDPDYVAVRAMVRRICDHCAKHNQTFALETGQEPAGVLLEFLRDVDRPNLKINFDPANMILYGTGDPIEAVGVLGKEVITVHCKDGDWPPKGVAGALGTEQPLGQGSVGMPQFISKLKEIGYRGTLNIEREGQSPELWRQDVKKAVGLLEKLRGWEGEPELHMPRVVDSGAGHGISDHCYRTATEPGQG